MIASAILLIFALGTSIQEMNGYDKIQSVGQNIDAEAVNTSSADEDDLVPIQWEEEKVTGEGSETLLYENALSEGAGQTSEKTAVENIVETSEKIAVENIVETSDNVAVENIVETSENVAVESIVETTENVAVESIGTDSEFVTNESSMPETEIVTQESEVQVEEIVLTEYVTYEVAKGDTLYGICVRFYGNLQRAGEICEINQIDDMDNILYGQKILLPR